MNWSKKCFKMRCILSKSYELFLRYGNPDILFWEPWKTNFIFLHFYDANSDSDPFWISRVAIYMLFVQLIWIMTTLKLKMLCCIWKFLKTHILYDCLSTSLHITKIIFIIWNENCIFLVFKKFNFVNWKLLWQSKISKWIERYQNCYC